MSNFKIKPFRSKKYLVWVKQLPCAVCGAPADDAHHLIGVDNMGGMGTKASDVLSMPVCRGCHTNFHYSSYLHDLQWRYIAITIDRALSEGVLIINDI